MDNLEILTPAVLFSIKIALWIFLFIYILFAAVVIKQIRVMIETLEVGFEKPIKILGVIHFIAALVIFIFSLFVL